MSGPRTIGLAAFVAMVCLAVPGGAAAAQTPSPACNGGGCGGWFRSNVTVTWSYDPGATNTQGCGASTVTEDTVAATFTCTVWYGAPFFGNSVTVNKDSSPPGVSVNPSRGPDSDGWYTSPLPFSVVGDDGASGVASCSSGTYSGPDGVDVRLSGSCTDNAGNSGSGSTSIKYDATPPTVAAAPARPPDANGWYNHPVQVAFTGADSASGVKECSPTASDYKGPDAGPARLVAQCRDAAGNLSAPLTFELLYDATPPARPKIALATRSAAVRLSWTAGKDIVLAEVVRAPGLRGKKPGIVFRGKARRYVDTRAKGNVRYWYQVRLYDQAGNRSAATVSRKPLRGIFAPAEGAVVRTAPVVEWAGVANARFYNLQLWLGRRKVLTTWPTATRFEVPAAWKYRGKRQRLVNGSYRVYVFPAFGTPRNPRFGDLVGQVGFVVKRR